MKKNIILPLFSVFILSCSMPQLSSQELYALNSGKRSILQTNNQPLIASMLLDEQPITQIVSIDDNKLESEIFKTDERLSVDIGMHKIRLNCVSRSGYDDRDYSETIEIEFKPFHIYQVRCSFDSHFGKDGTYKGSFSINTKETNPK